MIAYAGAAVKVHGLSLPATCRSTKAVFKIKKK